jgi:bifunctional non-homologous end joining protein LigD
MLADGFLGGPVRTDVRALARLGASVGRRDSMFGRNLLDGLPVVAGARLRKRAQPKWIAPMLATLTDEVFSRQGWLFEPKWDGERCLAFRRGRDLDLFSRNRIRLNAKYPEVVEAIYQQQATSFIADGEIVTFDGDITSFAKLQARMQVAHPPADLIRKVPVWFYLFDLLYLDRYDIRQVPLRYRKEVLRNAFDFQGSLRFTEHIKTEGEAYYRAACQKGWEGVIAKNGDSVYVSRRTRDWLKFKCNQEQEFVIGGYTDPRGCRTGFGALLLGFYRGRKLVYAGKVGTGFDHDLLRRLGEKLARLKTPVSPFCRGWAAATRRALRETEARRSNRIHRVDGGRQAATPSIPRPAG